MFIAMNCSEGTGFRSNTGLHVGMALQILLSSLSSTVNLYLLIKFKRYVFFHPNFKVSRFNGRVKALFQALVISYVTVNIVHSVVNILTQVSGYLYRIPSD